ncbi:MAG: hypothetical protein JNJ54_10350 [Myxococcaceae bacterium]|nr:hypothetical protein [Myxococcaceae bacterium]
MDTTAKQAASFVPGDGPSLPKGLQAALDAIVDRELAGRLERLGLAAARCIEQLQTITLVNLEPTTADEGSADLSLWEQMAPAVADTVASISGLTVVIDHEFSEQSSRTGVFSMERSDERAEAEAALVFRTVASLLKRELQQVRDMVRRPELMASRWALLEELQRLRADFRRRVGDAVYLSAAATGLVRRDDVVPGASQEVQRALLYRATSADLIKQVKARLARADEPLPRLLASLRSDLELFASMPAWRHVHAGPKRHLLLVLSLLSHEQVTRPSVEEAMQGLLDVLAELSEAMTREVLSSHDLQVIVEAGSRLEQARLHVRLGTGAESWALGAALSIVEKLRGRDERLDTLARQVRKDLEDGLTESVQADLDELRVALGRLGL